MDGIETFLPDLRKVMVKGSGHWTPQEKPAEVNAAIIDGAKHTPSEEMVNRLKRKVGELTMDLDILREAARLRPTTPGTSDE